jgi:ribA/ribD-fused uncharacterized protein
MLQENFETDCIKDFSGDYDFLSNFYVADIVFVGKTWPTVEHAYQAMKSREKAIVEHIRNTPSPRIAKTAGRRITVRSDWEKIKEDLMLNLLRAKFFQNNILAKKLLDTGSKVLIEKNYWHDNAWGDCSCERCENILGKNLLGKYLMQVRNELFFLRFNV